MYKYFLSCLLVGFLVYPSLGQNNAKQADFLGLKVKWRTYKKRQYKISYPKTWSVNRLRRQRGALLLAPKPETCQNAGMMTVINLRVYPLPEKDLASLIKKRMTRYNKMGSVKILKQSYVERREGNYYQIMLTRSYKDGVVVKYEDRYYAQGDKYYVLDFNGSPAGFEEHQVRARQIMDSFRLRWIAYHGTLRSNLSNDDV